MKMWMRLLAVAVVAGGVARGHEVAAEMAAAANKFVGMLSAEQKAKATFDFKHDERTHWEFVPKLRSGLTIKEMNEQQRLAAFALLASGLSPEGMGRATNIMSLDAILRELEKGSGAVRDPELYYVSIFGTPSAKGAWSWRVEGHHLSINFTCVDGKVVGTPEFYGSNPAVVLQGPRKGFRALPDEEDAAYELLGLFSDEQKKVVIYTDKAPNEILTGNKRKVSALETVGLSYAKMNDAQKAGLKKLVNVYANHHRAEVAADDLAKIEKAGWDNVHFGWAGSTEKGKLHYYRVQGPTFVMEMDNKDNGNHIHAAWRDFAGDFGEDLLGKHLSETPHK